MIGSDDNEDVEMADPKGPKDTGDAAKPADTGPVVPPASAAASEKGAANRSAAVKPPVLDMKANTTPPPGKTSSSKPSDPKPSAPTPPTPAGRNGAGFAWGAALGGGALGLAAAYGLAWAGLWPSAPVAPQAPDSRIASLSTAVPELQTVTETTQGELATLTQRVAELEAAPAAATTTQPAEAPDLSAISGRIDDLQATLQSLSATPAPTADSGTLETLRTQLTDLAGRLDELSGRVDTTATDLAGLETTVTENTQALAQQPSDLGAAIQLPLVLSSLGDAFATGRPFETELAALQQAAPGTPVPSTLAAAAGSGLKRQDEVVAAFGQAVPAMLAAQPRSTDGGLAQSTLDWLGNAVALRPIGEQEGNAPAALVSRLEAALARRDFAAAQPLFDALPQAMRDAAGTLGADIAAQAAATDFLTQLRSNALAGGTNS